MDIRKLRDFMRKANIGDFVQIYLEDFSGTAKTQLKYLQAIGVVKYDGFILEKVGEYEIR